VSLGICTQTALDLAVQKAASKSGKKGMGDGEALRTLIPASEVAGTEAYARAQEDAAAQASANETLSEAADRRQNEEFDADSVFAKLKGIKIEE
jgi:hypothetical protein